MSATDERAGGDHGAGVEILPGAVVVHLDVVDVHALSASDLQEAFDEADAQAWEEERDVEELLGDLDIHPR